MVAPQRLPEGTGDASACDWAPPSRAAFRARSHAVCLPCGPACEATRTDRAARANTADTRAAARNRRGRPQPLLSKADADCFRHTPGAFCGELERAAPPAHHGGARRQRALGACPRQSAQPRLPTSALAEPRSALCRWTARCRSTPPWGCTGSPASCARPRLAALCGSALTLTCCTFSRAATSCRRAWRTI
jgi:hypothetical protein